MCGIAGFVSARQLDATAAHRAVALRDALTHRGPNGAGRWTDRHAVLAHRRQSILDLEGGHQPMANEHGTVWVAFNGEIYNHADVRHDLEHKGHRFRTRSDTEVNNCQMRCGWSPWLWFREFIDRAPASTGFSVAAAQPLPIAEAV